MSEKLTEGEEILFRQVHPNFLDGGEPSSQTFMPTPKDENKLSVDRSAFTTAKESYALFAANGYLSAAVYGVTVEEFASEDIACKADPLKASQEQKANVTHAFADYSPHGTNQQKNKAKRIKRKALARGLLHP